MAPSLDLARRLLRLLDASPLRRTDRVWLDLEAEAFALLPPAQSQVRIAFKKEKPAGFRCPGGRCP